MPIFNLTNPYIKKLQCFLGISLTYFDLVFPLDWRNSVSKDIISLRETDLSVKLLDEIILHYVDMKGDFTYGTIGRVMMICLGSKTSVALYQHVINKLHWNPKWKSFVEKFRDDGLREALILKPFTDALRDTFKADRRLAGYISPDSFVHLLDRLLFVSYFLHESFYTSRSSFVGWLTYLHSPATPTKLFPEKKILFCQLFCVDVINNILNDVLLEGQATISWLQRSDNPDTYLPILLMKLVMMLCLIYLSLDSPKCSKELFDVMSKHREAYLDLLSYNRKWFPNEFMSNLIQRGRKGQDLILTPEMVAEAFSSIEDPLVIVYSGDVRPNIHAPGAIFVDLRNSREEIMSLIFQRKTTLSAQNEQTGDESNGVNTLDAKNKKVERNKGKKGKKDKGKQWRQR